MGRVSRWVDVMSEQTLTGENRCWRCTVANLVAGGTVGGLPLYAVWGSGNALQLALAAAFAVGVVGFTLYRVYAKGYLPGMDRVARLTGLHERIGPGSESREDETGP